VFSNIDAKATTLAFGYSQDMTYTVLESAISLATMSVAAATLITLSF